MAHQRLTGAGTGDCKEGDCPNVYLTDRGTLVFQGDQYAELAVPTRPAGLTGSGLMLRPVARFSACTSLLGR